MDCWCLLLEQSVYLAFRLHHLTFRENDSSDGGGKVQVQGHVLLCCTILYIRRFRPIIHTFFDVRRKLGTFATAVRSFVGRGCCNKFVIRTL